MKDFIYYRCGGSDGYRFGGEAICSNKQVQGKFLETAVWNEVCELLTNPQKLEKEYLARNKVEASFGNVEALKSQRAKLQHALERLIDSFTEGLIEKDQFTSRIDRTKRRIADLDAKIREDVGDVDRRENLRAAANRIRELATALGPEMASANHRRREIIRTLVQRIDIDLEAIAIIFRVAQNTRASGSDSITVTLSRP
jgi:site-specific DNA recombinase